MGVSLPMSWMLLRNSPRSAWSWRHGQVPWRGQHLGLAGRAAVPRARKARPGPLVVGCKCGSCGHLFAEAGTGWVCDSFQREPRELQGHPPSGRFGRMEVMPAGGKATPPYRAHARTRGAATCRLLGVALGHPKLPLRHADAGVRGSPAGWSGLIMTGWRGGLVRSWVRSPGWRGSAARAGPRG